MIWQLCRRKLLKPTPSASPSVVRESRQDNMPALHYVITGNDEKFAIVCQKAYRLLSNVENEDSFPRIMVLFICGEFTLEEVNAYALEAFDNPVIPGVDQYFSNWVDIDANAFQMPLIPLRLRYIIDNFSTADFVDKYTFFLMKLQANEFFYDLAEAEEKELRRTSKERYERTRLGLPPRRSPPGEVMPPCGADTVNMGLMTNPVCEVMYEGLSGPRPRAVWRAGRCSSSTS